MLKFICKPKDKMSNIELKKATYKLYISSILSIFVIILYISLYSYINNYIGISGIILYIIFTTIIIIIFKNMKSIKSQARFDLGSSFSALRKFTFCMFILSVLILVEVISKYYIQR